MRRRRKKENGKHGLSSSMKCTLCFFVTPHEIFVQSVTINQKTNICICDFLVVVSQSQQSKLNITVREPDLCQYAIWSLHLVAKNEAQIQIATHWQPQQAILSILNLLSRSMAATTLAQFFSSQYSTKLPMQLDTTHATYAIQHNSTQLNTTQWNLTKLNKTQHTLMQLNAIITYFIQHVGAHPQP